MNCLNRFRERGFYCFGIAVLSYKRNIICVLGDFDFAREVRHDIINVKIEEQETEHPSLREAFMNIVVAVVCFQIITSYKLNLFLLHPVVDEVN